MIRSLLTLLLVAFVSVNASAQTLDVTFRYAPQSGDAFFRAFLPGEFNGWGPNSGGVIAIGAPSAMTYDPVTFDFRYTTALNTGQMYMYKVHLHLNESGTSNAWLTDPYNPSFNPQDNNNSIITVTDPMVFQLIRHEDDDGLIVAVSAGLFGTAPINSIEFEVNGVAADGLPYFDATSRIFAYELPEPIPAGSQFKITATDSNSAIVADSVGLLPPVVVDEPLPGGIRDGINYDDSDNTKVTVSLFAPGISFVHVIGEFNGWQPSDEFVMKRDSLSADSIRFWLELPPVTPGQEYAFQYLINGETRVADPYSAKVLVPGEDAAIGAAYPGLKAYPTETSDIVSVLQVPTDPFEWTATDYERPDQNELVIYELLIRDFIASHDYATLIDTLDYLENLGVNAIELMPVAEFDGNESWGYNPAYHLALDKYYGAADDFKRFIDEAHKRNIAVILDVVYNHVTQRSPLYRIWGSATASPYLNTTATHPFSVFEDVNHEYPGTRYWLDRANEWWLTEYNVDGFRFDLSKGFTQKTSTDDEVFRLYDAGRVATLQRMTDRIWSIDSTAFVILEHFAANTEEKVLAEYRVAEGLPGMMLWGNQNHDYNEATMGYNNSGNSDFSYGFYEERSWSLPNLVTYMESHDEQWLMYKNIAFGACENHPGGGAGCNTDPGNYNIREFPVAFDRQKLAGAFFLTIPGPKMIWQFGELGYGYGPDGKDCLVNGPGLGGCPAGTPGRVDNKPIRWDYRADPLRYKIYQTWSELLRLRETLSVFRSSETTLTQQLSTGVKVLKLNHPFEADAVIIGNFGVAESTGKPGFFYTGFWYNFFTGETVEVTDTEMELSLLPGEFHVFTSERVGPPVPGLITVGQEAENGEVSASRVSELYPNPATSLTTLRIDVVEPALVSVGVYDIIGRRVMDVADGHFPAGVHSLSVETGALASGIYFVNVRTGDDQRTIKLIRR